VRQKKEKEQELTISEQLIEAFGHGGTPILEKELQTVFRKLDSPEKRLAWAIEFAQRNLEEITAGDLRNLRLEAGTFVAPEVVNTKTIKFNDRFFPVWGELCKMQQQFVQLLKAATSGVPFQFELPKLNISVSSDGVRYVIPSDATDPEKLADARLQQAVWTFGHLAGQLWNYIGFCDSKRFGCGKFFLKNRTNQEFCTHTCASRSTTYGRRGKERTA
jgi:hypothetical protein